MKAAAALLAALLLSSGVVRAQAVGRGTRPPKSSSAPADAREPSGSFQSHLSLPAAERLLASNNSDDRVRGVERLAASGQREAIDRLVHTLESSPPVWRDLRARLAALRALALYVSREPVRQVLVKALSTEPGRSPLALFSQQTAAMVLAASDDPRALEVLVSAVRQMGSAGEASERALLAYPPKSLAAFGPAHDGLAAPLSQLLGRLHDVRALGLLRGTLARGFSTGAAVERPDSGDASAEEQSKRARIAAALALSRLGDEEQLPVARSWLAAGDPDLKLAGAEVLVLSGAKEAEPAVAALLRAPELRARAIRLSAWMPSRALVAPLAEAALGVDEPGRTALAALGRIPSSEAVDKLSSLIRDKTRSWEAAFALARAPGPEARRALEDLLAQPESRRLGARAGVVRELILGDGPRGTAGVLRELLQSGDVSDRAAGAFGLAALHEGDLQKMLQSDDLSVVRAAARASLVARAEAGPACLARLAVEKDPLTRTALGLALAVSPEGWQLLSTEQLSAWADSDEPISPLSALALGERERDAAESAVRRLLKSPDPVLRAHAALGLGRSPLADASSKLADVLRFEPDESVRRAIVFALSQRTEAQRVAALDLASRFDPDARVRELARLALRGQLLRPLGQIGAACRRDGPGMCHVAWISLVPSGEIARAFVQNRPSRWLDASGLSLPIVADPDGVLVLPGVSPGPASFRLASSPFWYDARAHDVVEAEPGR